MMHFFTTQFRPTWTLGKSIESSRLQLEGLAQNRVTHAKKGFFASVKRTVMG